MKALNNGVLATAHKLPLCNPLRTLLHYRVKPVGRSRPLTLGFRMVKMKIIAIIFLILLLGCAHFPSPTEDAAMLSGTTRITLISLGIGAEGKIVPHRVVIDAPEQIGSLLSVLELVPAERSCCCLYSRSAVFETPQGDVHLGIGPHRIFVSNGRTRERIYYMPRQFYTLFENAFGREPAEYEKTQQAGPAYPPQGVGSADP